MKLNGTSLVLLCLFTALTAQAQPVRNGVDVLVARDVAGATLTLDGNLDEPEWQQADRFVLRWNETTGRPGNGQKIEATPPNSTDPEPTDPIDAVLYVLRDGNNLWLGIEANDRSIGGGRGLQAGNWDFDGFIVSMTEPRKLPATWPETQGNWATNTEFIYGWWHPADTSDATTTYSNGQLVGSGRGVPGIAPYAFGGYGVAWEAPMNTLTPEDRAVWDHATVVDGIANDDTHGEDNGYTTEWRINLDSLGYDMTQAGGDRVLFNFAIQDTDYRWPVDDTRVFTSRVWLQNQWANNYIEGVAYIYGAPDVTVGSALPEITEPEVRIPAAEADLTIDGMLDEADWTATDPQLRLQYQPDMALLDGLPGSLRYMYHFWRPDLNGEDPNPPVLDPSSATVRMLSRGNLLYVGLDVADQAIAGRGGDIHSDGFRLSIRRLDSLKTVGTLDGLVLVFNVDSTGALRYGGSAQSLHEDDPTSVYGAVTLKGASTAADPTDIDEGYTMEVAIDLTKAFGYDPGLGEGQMWFNLSFFDADNFEDANNDYSTSTWVGGETVDGAIIYAFLEAATGTDVEAGTEIPNRIALLGNYPNPFNPTTTLRYALPQAGEVTIQVFDVLGRRVSTLSYGLQAAGLNEATLDAAGLASGVYLYRVQVASQATGAVLASATGRMMLLK